MLISGWSCVWLVVRREVRGVVVDAGLPLYPAPLVKVSGSAARLTSSASFHHFTLLLNTDIDRMQKYLRRKQVCRVDTHTHTDTQTHTQTHTHTHTVQRRTHTHVCLPPSLPPQLNLTQKAATPSVATSVANLASSVDGLQFDSLCTAVATVMWQEHQVPFQDQKVRM